MIGGKEEEKGEIEGGDKIVEGLSIGRRGEKCEERSGGRIGKNIEGM